MNNETFESYLSRALDHDLSPAEFHEFEQYLMNSPEARTRYMEYVDLHTVLDLELTNTTPEQVGVSKVIDITRIVRRQNRRALKIVALSTAAILLIGFVSMSLFFIEDPEPAIVFETSPGTKYTLKHSSTKEAPEGLVLEKGSRLQLAQGSVELTFESGVTSVIMAPADLTLREENVLVLNKGTAWFNVPEEAIGFNVKTKDLDIVDLGTEFGVLSRSNDYDELHVFKGKVRVSALRHRKESTTLIAGQATRIDSIGRLTTIPAKNNAFLTSLPESLPYIRWSFDKEDGFQATGNHVAVKDITTTAQASPTLMEGKHGDALYLNGQSQHLTTNWKGFSGRRARTVTCWLRLPIENNVYSRFQGIVGWGLWNSHNAKWKVTVNQSTPTAPTLVRFALGEKWIDGSTQLADNKWHHVAITTNGQLDEQGKLDIQLYIDGKLEEMTYSSNKVSSNGNFDFVTDTSNKKSVPLLIGTTLQHNPKQRTTLKGAIDELTIFDGHMTADEIKQTMTP